MTWMGYYSLPDAIASINNDVNEEDKHRVENDARENEDLQEAGHSAARSGDLELILALSPTQFEFTMAAILWMLGMTDIQRVGGRGHFGVDIAARDATGRTMLVRCKRRAKTKKIGSPDIEKFIGVAHMHHQADPKLFIATSDYTDHAQTRAHLHGIELMNGSDIEELARQQRDSVL
jgi:restriction system protein